MVPELSSSVIRRSQISFDNVARFLLGANEEGVEIVLIITIFIVALALSFTEPFQECNLKVCSTHLVLFSNLVNVTGNDNKTNIC